MGGLRGGLGQLLQAAHQGQVQLQVLLAGGQAQALVGRQQRVQALQQRGGVGVHQKAAADDAHGLHPVLPGAAQQAAGAGAAVPVGVGGIGGQAVAEQAGLQHRHLRLVRGHRANWPRASSATRRTPRPGGGPAGRPAGRG
jgi:hypothetical protein